ncbi:MAG: 30S ribosomal protein S5, partial [Nitrosopumilus sp.]|nr:30S ribosomal protein S5 [Nitrosopumilus sp.]
MSQATQSKPGQSKPGQGGRGRGPPVYGRGPPGAAAARPKRPRREPEVEVWVPKTILGKKVDSGEITTIEEILEAGLRIQESG